MKAIVNVEHPQLAGIFDKGDTVEIEVLKTKYQRHLNNIIGPGAKYAPAGEYNGFRVQGKNGEFYNEEFFRGIFGYKPMNELFSKLV